LKWVALLKARLLIFSSLAFLSLLGNFSSRRLKQVAAEFVHGRDFAPRGKCHASRLRFTTESFRCDGFRHGGGMWCACRLGSNFARNDLAERLAANAG
jgi:hypothetical protein